MKRQIISFGLLTVFSIIIIFSCDDTNVDDGIDIPSENISYSQHIQPVFNLKCNSKDCHNDIDYAGGLSLTSYANTTADYLIVAPGKPDNSKLIWSIKAESAYPMPPPGYQPLTLDQINGITKWVEEGAKNN